MSKTFELKYRSRATERVERIIFEGESDTAEALARERARAVHNATGVVNFKLFWPDTSTTRFTLESR
jgi:hypothetical protein